MLDPNIQNFLNERKAMWLKKKMKAKTTEEEKIAFEREADALFSLSLWLPNAAKRAKQLSLVSHPSKFTHPSAKISSIIATAEHQPDGYLRTGNVAVDLDVFGNAAAMDVYKFLSIELNDGQTVLQHLEQQTDCISTAFKLPDIPYEALANDLLAIKQKGETKIQTSGKIKQVYFPIACKTDEYHLLSVLTPSGIMYKLKERLMAMRFSEKTKLAREAKKKEQAHKQGFSDIYNLSAIGFGGTKPQNISVLNSKQGGVANLLSSMPPALDKQHVSPPQRDFIHSINPYFFSDEFHALDKQLRHNNNYHVRHKINQLIQSIVYQLIDTSWRVRRLDAGWSLLERSESLPHYQKIWLDQHFKAARISDDTWLDKVKKEIARWFITAYQKTIHKNETQWDDSHLLQLKNIINNCEEALK
jgi:CRISPR-associated protein Csy1